MVRELTRRLARELTRLLTAQLFPRLHAVTHVLNERREEAGSNERFQATCGLKACGELAPLVAAAIPASSAPADASCCALRQEAVQLTQDSFASVRCAAHAQASCRRLADASLGRHAARI